MVSLWGSKSGEEHAEGEGGEHDGEESRHSTRQSGGPEPHERTRLLPPRNDGYLDPDDPAVSLVKISEPRETLRYLSRYHPTTYGACELSDISASSSSASASCGGSYYLSPFSSARR